MVRRSVSVGSAWVIAVLVAACTRPDRDAAPPVFGGQGAQVTREQVLTPADKAGASATGPCATPRAPGDTALFDDFEDADSKIFKGFQREGWWYAAADATPGATLRPASGSFLPERLPAAEATNENLFAAHLVASGQKDWGVVWGVALRWADQGVRCPFNASGFDGIKLRAKGPGTVHVTFAMPETTPAENGGTCKQGCYDSHGKLLFLNDRWQEYVIRWEQLQQGGWGAQARFDPQRLLDLGLKVDAKNLPADFWVDDIAFLPKSAPSVAAGGKAP